MITARDRFFMRLKPEDVLKAMDTGTDVTFAVDYDLELRFNQDQLWELFCYLSECRK